MARRDQRPSALDRFQSLIWPLPGHVELCAHQQQPNRGVNDILIANIDGLKGFLETIDAVFPETQIQI